MRTKFFNYLKSVNRYYYLTLLIVFLLSSVVIRNCLSSTSLKKHGIIVNVKILEYLPPGKAMSQANYRCEFLLKGEIKRLISQSRIRNNKRFYEGQYFPALYSEKYDKLRVLMTPEDFQEFDLLYPDSLLFRVVPVN